MCNPTLATATFLLGIVLAPATASQVDTTSRPGTTSEPQKPKPDDEAQKRARRWVTFLELEDRRAEAADALLKIGAKAVPALVQALHNPRPAVVQRACHILRFGSQAAAAKERLVALSKSEDPKLVWAARYALAGIQPIGITLVADKHANCVLELDRAGEELRTLTEAGHPMDAERLPNGNYLVCGYKKVMEMTVKSKVVWSYAKLKEPHKAQRLPNGNTLIADGDSHRVLEVDRDGKTVWDYHNRRLYPLDAERLLNGNTLISDLGGGRVIDVTPKGEIVWEYEHYKRTKRSLSLALDADRLPNGNTLITINNASKVIEVTPKGKVVWELDRLNDPHDAERLPNGHTLVGQRGEVTEFDAKGKVVWSAKVTLGKAVRRY